MIVTPSPLVPVTSVPTDPTQVWDLSSLFLASWDEKITLENDWGGNVTEARSGAEQRLCMTARPTRAMHVTLKAFHTRETWQLINKLKRMAMARCLMPLYCDALVIVSASGTTLAGNAADRRFYPGGRVVIGKQRHTPSGVGPECDQFETATIQSVSPTGVTLTAPTAGTYGPGCLAWPCMEVEVFVPASMSLLTDRHAHVGLVCREVVGPSALPPWATDADLPLDCPTYSGMPVFCYDDVDIPQDPTGASYGWKRTIRSNHTGISDTFELVGSRPKATRSWTFYPYTRAGTARVLRFWDACSGQMVPFVGASPMHPFDVWSVAANQIQVDPGGDSIENWQDFSLVAVKLQNTPVQVVPVSSVADSGGTRTINLGSSLATVPGSGHLLRWVAPAHVMRFDGTTCSEAWLTTEHCNLDLSAVELLDEGSYSINS